MFLEFSYNAFVVDKIRLLTLSYFSILIMFTYVIYWFIASPSHTWTYSSSEKYF